MNIQLLLIFNKEERGSEHRDITENLWLFYQEFINKNKITPLNKILSEAIKKSDAIYDSNIAVEP